MSISVAAKNQPTLRDIAFVMLFAKNSKKHANPVGTATSEIPGTLCDILRERVEKNIYWVCVLHILLVEVELISHKKIKCFFEINN